MVWVLFSKVGFDFVWGAIVEMLVEFGFVLSRHSLVGCVFYFDNVGSTLSMDQLIFIGTVAVFCLGIVLGVANGLRTQPSTT